MTLSASPILYRTHRPGDMGYIIYRHALIYAQEYQWDEHFEAMVAKIAADFIQNYNPALERCWIAERDGPSWGASVSLKIQNEITRHELECSLLNLMRGD